MEKFSLRKLSHLLIFSVLFLTTCSASTAQPVAEATATPPVVDITSAATTVTAESTTDPTIQATAEITPTAYLPFINRAIGKFFGVYFNQYWTPQAVAEVMPVADQGAGKQHSAVGWFIDLEDTAFTVPIYNLPGNNLYSQLEALWDAGYISFINLGSNANAGQIINGERNAEIGYAAEFYKAWVDQGEGRRAMIAPLQEMNGEWTAYGRASTSEEYKQAYYHILNIFTSQGVTRDMVWWVFAPNGYHDPAQPQRAFEYYYPGDDVVDIVGFSSYNYGFCPAIPEAYRRWESFNEIFEPYIARMQAMAPSKPIIIAETASTAYYAHDGNGVPIADPNAKNQWLIENYDYFAKRKCGWDFFQPPNRWLQLRSEIDPNGVVLSGYMDGLSNSIYRSFNTAEMEILVHRFE
jgi:hypothetical protein